MSESNKLSCLSVCLSVTFLYIFGIYAQSRVSESLRNDTDLASVVKFLSFYDADQYGGQISFRLPPGGDKHPDGGVVVSLQLLAELVRDIFPSKRLSQERIRDALSKLDGRVFNDRDEVLRHLPLRKMIRPATLIIPFARFDEAMTTINESHFCTVLPSPQEFPMATFSRVNPTARECFDRDDGGPRWQFGLPLFGSAIIPEHLNASKTERGALYNAAIVAADAAVASMAIPLFDNALLDPNAVAAVMQEIAFDNALLDPNSAAAAVMEEIATQ